MYGNSPILVSGEPQKIPPLPRLRRIESGSVGMTLDNCVTDSIPYTTYMYDEREIQTEIGTQSREAVEYGGVTRKWQSSVGLLVNLHP